MVSIHVQHPPEAAVTIHQVERVRGGDETPPAPTAPPVPRAPRPAPLYRVLAQSSPRVPPGEERAGYGYCFRQLRGGEVRPPPWVGGTHMGAGGGGMGIQVGAGMGQEEMWVLGGGRGCWEGTRVLGCGRREGTRVLGWGRGYWRWDTVLGCGRRGRGCWEGDGGAGMGCWEGYWLLGVGGDAAGGTTDAVQGCSHREDPPSLTHPWGGAGGGCIPILLPPPPPAVQLPPPRSPHPGYLLPGGRRGLGGP